ncbi:hypothetical protein [Sphingomonas sp. RS2018]
MLHFYDRVTIAHALSLDLDPRLHKLLAVRIAALPGSLIDHTEYLVVEAGDTEADIVRHVGFSPLIEPIDGARFGEPGFHPFWDYLQDRNGWFEMIVTFGSTFAYVLLIQDAETRLPELLTMCRRCGGRPVQGGWLKD